MFLLLFPPITSLCPFFSFRPDLPVSYIQSELAFANEEECQSFLASLSLVFAGNDASKIDCKLSLAVLPNF
uniref:Uncharacterized protein n=1 Tax=Xenopus tropicalis TaxID=8364 RepID=A0A1B8XUB4_XENTR